MAKKEKSRIGCVMALAWILVIFTLLWVLSGFGLFTWNIPWMPIAFFIIALFWMMKLKMWMK